MSSRGCCPFQRWTLFGNAQIADEEVRMRGAISGGLQPEHVDEGPDPWEGTPFAWIKTRPSSRQRGQIAEELIAGRAEARDLGAMRRTS